MVPPPDAVVGRHGPRAPSSFQRHIGFGNSSPISCPPIANGVATFGCDMEAGDNLVKGATGGAHSQLATEEGSGPLRKVMVHQIVKLGSKMQPEPPVLPSNLLVASSTVHLLKLPMRVHRACGAEGQYSESCSCLASASWKPVPASAWNGMCTESCGDAASAAVALVDSGALHSCVSAELVSRFSLPVKPGGNMEVTLADVSQVEVSQTCCIPLVVCFGDC